MPARTEPRPPNADVAARAARGILSVLLLAVSPGAEVAHAQGRDLLNDNNLPPAAPVPFQHLVRMAFRRTAEFEGLRLERARLESSLRARIARLDRLSRLSATQSKKLLLAGRADVDRFFVRVDETERKLSTVVDDGAESQKVLDELESLTRLSKQGLFGDGSLFSKVLANTLTNEQVSKYQEVERKLAIERHMGTLQWVLGTWDQTLKLSAEQHRGLDAFLRDQTRPPARNGEYDYYGVLLQLSRLPQDNLKRQFNDAQWAVLGGHLAEATRLKGTLKEGGYLPKEEVASGSARTNETVETPEKKRG